MMALKIVLMDQMNLMTAKQVELHHLKLCCNSKIVKRVDLLQYRMLYTWGSATGE